MAFYTYIVASRRNGALYIGSTDDLIKRIGQHREKTFQGFTAKYASTSWSGTKSMTAARPLSAANAS